MAPALTMRKRFLKKHIQCAHRVNQNVTFSILLSLWTPGPGNLTKFAHLSPFHEGESREHTRAVMADISSLLFALPGGNRGKTHCPAKSGNPRRVRDPFSLFKFEFAPAHSNSNTKREHYKIHWKQESTEQKYFKQV